MGITSHGLPPGLHEHGTAHRTHTSGKQAQNTISISILPEPTDRTLRQLPAWNKVNKFLREHANYSDPLEYIKHSIQQRIKDHIKSSSDNVVLLQGDLNSSWGSTAVGGCHKHVSQWAGTIALSNPLYSLTLQLSKPLFTHWIARNIGSGAEHVGISWIDHVLLHSNGHPQLVRGGCEDHNEWVVVSDH